MLHFLRNGLLKLHNNKQHLKLLSQCGTQSEDKPKRLLRNVSEPVERSKNRVTIVGGAGAVGIATAFCLLTQNVCHDVVLIDQAENKLKGEVLDLQHGSMYLHDSKISGSSDYAASVGSKICIITAGIGLKGNQTRLDVVQANAEIYKKMIPSLVKHSPDTIFLIVSNPCDILTYAAWKISGLPPHKIMGSGTNLDTARFRFLMSRKLGITSSGCHGWILGEHGNSCVPIWSGVNIAGVSLRYMNPKAGLPDDPENWDEVHKNVLKGAYEVRMMKGYTSWAVGLSCSAICRSILHNTGGVHAVTVNAKGFQGIAGDVYLSLPATLGENGITNILEMQIDDHERDELQKSAQLLDKTQSDVKL